MIWRTAGWSRASNSRPSAYVSRRSTIVARRTHRNGSAAVSSSPCGPENVSPPGSFPDASISPPSSRVRHLPITSKFSSANPSGSIRDVAGCAGGIAPVPLHLLPRGQLSPVGRAFIERRHAGGGGGGGGEFSRLSRIHLPRSTGDVLAAWDVSSRMLPWVSSPPRSGLAAERNAAKAGPDHAVNSIQLRQSLVEVRVVGAEQIENAAVLADQTAHKEARLLFEARPQRRYRIRDRPAGPARSPPVRAAPATAPAKLSASVAARGSASMRRTSRVQRRRIAQLPAAAPHPAARRPECCSTKRRTGGRPAPKPETGCTVPGAAPAGSNSRRNRKSGASSNIPDGGGDRFVEAVLLPRRGVSSQKRLQVRRGDVAPESPARHGGKDTRRAGGSSAGARRPADEDPPPARRLADSRRIVWPGDLDPVQRRRARLPVERGLARRSSRRSRTVFTRRPSTRNSMVGRMAEPRVSSGPPSAAPPGPATSEPDLRARRIHRET